MVDPGLQTLFFPQPAGGSRGSWRPFVAHLSTGMRVGEALGLRHEDIDAAGTAIQIRKRRNSNGARVKGGQREIPVPPSLIRLYTDDVVEEYGDLDCDYVFVNVGADSRALHSAIGTSRTSSNGSACAAESRSPHPMMRRTVASEGTAWALPSAGAAQRSGITRLFQPASTSQSEKRLPEEGSQASMVSAGAACLAASAARHAPILAETQFFEYYSKNF